MASLAYCAVCRATYPQNIVVNPGGRSGRPKEPVCPMGHAQVELLDAPPKQRGKK